MKNLYGASPEMTPSMMTITRAYLMAASLSAASLQVVVVAMIFLGGTPEMAFKNETFHLIAVLLICGMVLGINRLSRAAFDAARHCGHVSLDSGKSASVSSTCPKRQLVMLYLQFKGTTVTPSWPC
jgi:F0F1-type ATP synthase assembly protein I